jgi:putative transcriptional regulator
MVDDFAVQDAEDNPDWTTVPTSPVDASGKLRFARVFLEMSQSEFAALLDIPLATLQNWEQRRTEPDSIARTLIDLIFDDPEGMRTRLNKRRAA